MNYNLSLKVNTSGDIQITNLMVFDLFSIYYL